MPEVDEWERRNLRSDIRERLAGMPAGKWARVDNPMWRERIDPRLQRVATHWDPSRGNLLMLGKSGLGKTFTLVALAHRLATEAVADFDENALIARACWRDGYGLVTARRQHRLGKSEAPDVQSALAAGLLFLDEIGHEPEDPVLWEIADQRYRHNRLTLTTSGMTRAQLDDRYGEAFVRRLVEPKGAVLDLWEGS